MQKKFKAILFDLDGTLLDTAPDLAAALNHVLESEHWDPLPLSAIRPVASDGAAGLLKLGFNIEKSHPSYYNRREKLLDYYYDHIDEHSKLFDGIENILNDLMAKNIPWGIVTNKPTELTHKLLKKLKLDQKINCVVCGDTLPKAKPDPAPILYAAQLLNLSVADCCYVGDHERDIIAAKAANMYVIAALYGYIQKNIDPLTWKADAYIRSPMEIFEVVSL